MTPKRLPALVALTLITAMPAAAWQPAPQPLGSHDVGSAQAVAPQQTYAPPSGRVAPPVQPAPPRSADAASSGVYTDENGVPYYHYGPYPNPYYTGVPAEHLLSNTFSRLLKLPHRTMEAIFGVMDEAFYPKAPAAQGAADTEATSEPVIRTVPDRPAPAEERIEPSVAPTVAEVKPTQNKESPTAAPRRLSFPPKSSIGSDTSVTASPKPAAR